MCVETTLIEKVGIQENFQEKNEKSKFDVTLYQIEFTIFSFFSTFYSKICQ